MSDSNDGKMSFAEWIKANRAQQPALGAELRAMGRATREDLWNNFILPFPQEQAVTREPGAPGSPTMQQTTEDLNQSRGR